MKEQLPYYEDRQQEAWEDYQNLEQQREDLHRQCLEQSLTISEANERIKVLEDALRDIARQNLESEIHEDYREDADYRGAYDCIIRVARAALEVKP